MRQVRSIQREILRSVLLLKEKFRQRASCLRRFLGCAPSGMQLLQLFHHFEQILNQWRSFGVDDEILLGMQERKGVQKSFTVGCVVAGKED